MKKSIVTMMMVIVMLVSLTASASAVEPRALTAAPRLEIEGTTAHCEVSITDYGKNITATMNLWQGSTLVDSWSGTATSNLFLEGYCDVESGKVYVLYVSGTVGGESFYTQPVTVRCE